MSAPGRHPSHGLIFIGLLFSVGGFWTVGVRSNLPPNVFDRRFVAAQFRWIGLLLAAVGVALLIAGH